MTRYFTISVPLAPFVVLVKVYVPGVVNNLDCASLPKAGTGFPAGTLHKGGFALPEPPVPIFPELPAGTVDPEGAVGAARATVGSVKVTLKHWVSFGVVVDVNVCEKTAVGNTPQVTTAPVVVAFGLRSIAAWVADTVTVSGKKMIPVPDVAVVIDIVAVTGSVIVIGKLAVLVTPPTVLLAKIVAVPGLIPVTIPVDPTVATDGSLVKNAGLPSPPVFVAARCDPTVAPPASVYVTVRVSVEPAPFVEREDVNVIPPNRRRRDTCRKNSDWSRVR
ncbi:MAG: hypothetical protein ACJ78G_11625, partial [Gemmatimonadaceae bacterium]